MATKILKTVPKISVKIWRPIIKKLDQKLDDACLRRDAYLNRVLEAELSALEKEVSIPNSLGAQAFVAERLDQLDRKLVSLALRPDLVERLNEICRRKRIVRDAFFNRLFLLLAVAPEAIDALFFGADAEEWKRDIWRDCKDDREFWENNFYPLEPVSSPFWAIRTALELYSEQARSEELPDPASTAPGQTVRVQRELLDRIYPLDSVYTRTFGKEFKNADLTGLNCYIPDWQIPGSKEALAYQKELDELLVL